MPEHAADPVEIIFAGASNGYTWHAAPSRLGHECAESQVGGCTLPLHARVPLQAVMTLQALSMSSSSPAAVLDQILEAVLLKPDDHKIHGKTGAKSCQSCDAAAAALGGNRSFGRQKLEDHMQAMHVAADNLD